MAFKTYTPVKLSENMAETDEGFLLCSNVRIARTGIQDYGPGETPIEEGDDGLVHITRDAKEVFDPRTIASFEGKPVTIEHPPDFVDPKNWKRLAVGHLRNVRKGAEPDEDGEESLLADILIQDADAIKLIKQGMRDVSCGYDAQYVYPEDGKGEGEQTEIIGNHLALVKKGRAGESYAIQDAAWDAITHAFNGNRGTEQIMSTKAIDRLKKVFGAKAVDEAMIEPKEEKKEEKATDADELVKMVKDLGEKMDMIGGLLKMPEEDGGGKGINKEDKAQASGKIVDDEEEPVGTERKEPAKEVAKDDDEEEMKDDAEENEVEGDILARVKNLEALCAKMLKGKSEDDDCEDDDDMSESEDDEEVEMESADDDESMEGVEGEVSQKKEKAKAGDEAFVRASILAPGIKKVKNTDIRVAALKEAMHTHDGREVILSLTKGKAPVYKDKDKVESLFYSASEILKAKRTNQLAGTKDSDIDTTQIRGEMTAERLNRINEAYWANRTNKGTN